VSRRAIVDVLEPQEIVKGSIGIVGRAGQTGRSNERNYAFCVTHGA